jgi:hypothetical protein
MRRRFAPTLTALACVLALAGCSRSDSGSSSGGGAGSVGVESADALVKALDTFTEELLAKVEAAPDTKAGVAEAQALLDARKGELAGRVAAAKRSAQGAEAKRSLLEAEVDGTQRVNQLRVKYLDASMRDPELKAGLDRLVADYDTLFKDR